MDEITKVIAQINDELEKGNDGEVRRLISDLKNEDIAEIVNGIDPKNKHLLLKLLNIDDAAEVLSEVDETSEQAILENVDKFLLSDIIEAMEQDDAADLIQSMDEDEAAKIFNYIDSGASEKIKELLNYPEESAGGIMNTDFISLNRDMTVDEAISLFRSESGKTKIFHAYVVDKLKRLIGIVSLRKLVSSPGNSKIKDIMYTDIIKVKTTDDQENVARVVSKYNLLAVPVVDAFNRLVGIVTVDDVIDVINAEATEDIYKMAGTNYEELEHRSIFSIARFRIPWLAVSFVGEMISGIVLRSYNATLSQVIILASFIPVIMAMGGNVGTQSATIVVRSIATGRFAHSKVLNFILREIGIGAIIGLISGLLVGIVSQFWDLNVYLGVIIGVSMFLAMTMAATVGAVLPLIFDNLNVDPAVATGPFVTTFNDITGLFIYLTAATLLLKYLV